MLTLKKLCDIIYSKDDLKSISGRGDNMTDTKALYNAIERSGYLKKYIARQLGISYQGFLNKAKNRSEFTASEIEKLKDLLSLSSSERDAIFFAA